MDYPVILLAETPLISQEKFNFHQAQRKMLCILSNIFWYKEGDLVQPISNFPAELLHLRHWLA